jgi:hypothetical protein
VARITEANLDDYEDIKKADNTQSYYDDYSVYSYLESSIQNSTAVRRNKSANFVKSQSGSLLGEGTTSRFIKAKTHVGEGEGKEGMGAKMLDDSIQVNGSLMTFDKPKGKGEQGTEEEGKDTTGNSLGIINEVNERDFDTNGRESLGGGNRSTGKVKEHLNEPNFL